MQFELYYYTCQYPGCTTQFTTYARHRKYCDVCVGYKRQDRLSTRRHFEELDGEIWAPVYGFPDFEVSQFARVRKGRNLMSVMRYEYNNGVKLTDGSRRKTMSLGSVVLMAFQPQYQNHLVVKHLDNDLFNDHLDNLYWGHRRSRLNAKDVQEIRAWYRRDPLVRQEDIGDHYGIAAVSVNHIINYRTWRHVE